MAAERDQVCIAGLKDRVGRFTRETARRDQGALVVLADELGRHRILVTALVFGDTQDARLDQVQIGEVQLVQLACDIGEQANGVAVGHVAEIAARPQTHRHPIAAPDGDHRLYRFEQEPAAVLERATVDIRTFVAAVLEELIEQVAVG
ncbi:hypothetical protein D3C86_1180850 [compost metagenome]